MNAIGPVIGRRLWRARWWGWVFVLLALAFMLALSSCGGARGHPKATIPPAEVVQPIVPKPGAAGAPQAPGCDARAQAEVEAGDGSLGVCAPHLTAFGGAPPTTPMGITGPDVSNNDPFFTWHPVRAHGHPFAYNKIIQGTRFVDLTAAGMASAQRAASIVPGGYDFLEVCRTSSAGEARLFASRLKAIGLTGKAFVPIGDAEWPLKAPCSVAAARAWITSWIDTVHALVGRWPGIYTGAWWSNPNLGCWRPPHALRWVSGFGSRGSLPIPCGWGGVDLWQYTDAGFNGVTFTDMSRLEVPQSRFEARPARRNKKAELNALYRQRKKVRALIVKHACRPGQHAKPRRYHTVCGYWLHEETALEKKIRAFHAQHVY